MKKNMKAFFSQLYPLPEETPATTPKREEIFRISRGNQNTKNHSQEMARSYEHSKTFYNEVKNEGNSLPWPSINPICNSSTKGKYKLKIKPTYNPISQGEKLIS
jgi:hypothetical protein